VKVFIVNTKDFIKIINEEIQEFDFLGNDEHSKEMEVISLLKNEDFQKQFICDALLRKIEVKNNVTDNMVSDDSKLFTGPNHIDIEILVEVTYKYDQSKEPVQFELAFVADNIEVDTDSDYDAGRWGVSTDDAVAPSGGDWINYINWDKIKVDLFSTEGDEIEFLAFEHAPPKIQTLFVREYCESNIEDKSDYRIEVERADKIQNIPYC